MIEFKTEIEDIIKEEHNSLAGAKVTIVYEPASNTEIKIENETFLCDHNDNVGELSTKHREKGIDNNNPVNIEVHQCYSCTAVLSSREDFLKHQRKIHRNFICNDCDEEFSKWAKYRYHRQIRHKRSNLDKTYECDFKNCNFKHKTLAGLRYHRLRHDETSWHVCHVCKKSFPQVGELNRHLRVHTGERPYRCDICPNAYSSITRLRTHKYSHIGLKPFVCKFCSKGFSRREAKKDHERIHTGEKPYTCELCQKSFRTSTGLSAHTPTHTGVKRHMCKVCHRSFTQSNHLQQHERIHTGEKPYSCNVCDYRFAQLGHLNTHLKTHTRGTPFSCKTCQSTFSLKSQLTAHEKIHTSPTVFICDLCDKTYLEKRSLRTHLSKCVKERAAKDFTCTTTSDEQQGNIRLRITRLRQQM